MDKSILDANYRQLQAVIHPDKFVSRPASEQRMAAARSADLNTAYQTLKNPAQRAQYLCDLNADSIARVDRVSPSKLPTEFLMEQMQYREALGEAKAHTAAHGAHATAEQLEALRVQVVPIMQRTHDDLARLLDDEHNFESAQLKVNEFMFIDKLLAEIGDAQLHLQLQTPL